MHARLARQIVRRFAWLAPRDDRARWREEWLAEIDAALDGGTALEGGRRGARPGVLLRTFGAPIDAALLRLAVFDRSFFAAWGSDLREALREWRRAPVRSAVTAVCLTGGIAASIVAFAIANYWVAGELTGIRDRTTLARVVVMRGTAKFDPSVEEFQAITATSLSSAVLAASTRARHLASIDRRPFSLDTQAVSGGFFDVLGTAAAVGRLLQPTDDRPDAAPVAVISHAMWQRHFGGRADVVGLHMALSSPASNQPARDYVVVGVTPPGFAGTEFPDLDSSADRPMAWVPMAVAPPESGLGRSDFLPVIARLSTPIRVAQTEVDSRLRGAGRPGRSAALLPFYAAPVNDPAEVYLTSLLLIGVPLALVLLVCVNVAGIRLAGAAARTHELAVRTSLGASRARLVRLLTTDAMLLATVSTAGAWSLATAFLRWAQAFLPAEPDWRVLAFAATLAGVVSAAAGLLPALRVTGRRTLQALASTSPSVAGSRLRGYRWLTVVQMALSLAVLWSGALGVRAVRNMTTDRFDVAPVTVTHITVTDPALDAARRWSLLDDVQRQIAGLPAIESVALSTMGTFHVGTVGFRLDTSNAGRALPPGGAHGGHVSPSYFRTVGLRTLEGRTFTDADGPAVAVVSEAFTGFLPADQPVLGTRLRQVRVRRDQVGDVEIIGVVSDGIGFAELHQSRTRTPTVFLPLGAGVPADVALFTRSPLSDETARRLAALDIPGAPLLVNFSNTLREALEERREPLVWISRALGIAAVVALTIAGMGLWAVASAAVARRRREFGVRLAIGATPAGIARLLLEDTTRVAGVGTGLGIAMIAPGLIAMRGELIGVEAWDPVAATVSIVVLAGAAFAATIGPALRASRVDPLEILRVD